MAARDLEAGELLATYPFVLRRRLDIDSLPPADLAYAVQFTKTMLAVTTADQRRAAKDRTARGGGSVYPVGCFANTAGPGGSNNSRICISHRGPVPTITLRTKTRIKKGFEILVPYNYRVPQRRLGLGLSKIVH